MKRILLILVIMFLFVAGASADSAREIRKHAVQISNAIAVPLYSYDLSSVESVITSIVGAEADILAVELIDFNSEEVIYAAIKSDSGALSVLKTVPAGSVASLKAFPFEIVYEGESLGTLRLYHHESSEPVTSDLTEEKSSSTSIWIIIAILSTLIVLFLLGTILSWANKSDKAIQLGTKSFRWRTILVLGLFITIVILASWLTLQGNKEKILSGVEDNLRSTLQTTWERMHVWVGEKKIFLRQLGRDPELVDSVESLVDQNRKFGHIVGNFDQSRVPTFFAEHEDELGSFIYLVVDNERDVIASNQRDLRLL